MGSYWFRPLVRSCVSFNTNDSRRLQALEPQIQQTLDMAIKDPYTFRFCDVKEPEAAAAESADWYEQRPLIRDGLG